MTLSGRRLAVEIAACYIICIILTMVDVACIPLGFPVADLAWCLAVGALVALPILAVRRVHPRSEDEAGIDLKITRRGILFGLAAILALLLPVWFGHHLWQTRFLGADFVPDISRLSTLPRALWLEIPIQIFCVALPEEFFYRGYVQTALTDKFKNCPRLSRVAVPLAIGLASLLFAASHLPSGNFTRLLTFFPGLLFGLLRYKSDSLWAPILCHAACNLMMVGYGVFYI